MPKLLIIGFSFLFLFVSNIFSNPVDKITFMTENSPPYNFLKNKKLKGTAVDLLVKMLEKVEAKQKREDIIVLPWSRGYAYVQSQKNSSLFATTRTDKREKLFKWVGPISKIMITLIAKKSKHVKISNLEDLKKYKIGVVREDIGEQLLLNLNVNKKQIENTGGIDAIHKVIKMLNRDRFDVLSYNEESAFVEIGKLGFESSDYERVYVLSESALYYAFHIDTSEEVITTLQNALDELKKDGTYDKIFDSYK